jgi:hypothetical protein
MGSECSRIAELASGYRLLVFSFWTGKLPEISRIHFLTMARALPEDSRYVLFVDKATLSSSMLELLGRCKVDVVAIELPQLLLETGLGKFASKTPLSAKWGSVWRALGDHKHLTKFSRLGHYHPTFRFVPRYNILLGSPPVDATTSANYLRVVVSSIVQTDTLYTDVDFAFSRPLDWIYKHQSFVYSWERRPFANNALMSVRKESPIKTGALIDLLKREGTARSYILFSEANCRACDLEILSCDRLDPRWSATTPMGPRFFFIGNDQSQETLRILRTEFDAIHWHNRWDEVPDSGSPCDLWLRELMAGD